MGSCYYPDCNGNVQETFQYCCKHECAESGCHKPRVKEDSLYCFDHKCIVCEGLRRNDLSNHCKFHTALYWIFYKLDAR